MGRIREDFRIFCVYDEFDNGLLVLQGTKYEIAEKFGVEVYYIIQCLKRKTKLQGRYSIELGEYDES